MALDRARAVYPFQPRFREAKLIRLSIFAREGK